MKNLHLRLASATLLGCAVIATAEPSHAAVRSTEVAAPKLPEIWTQAGPRERLKATRAAELDADRLLVERLYGIKVDSNTTVGDLAMRDDSIAGIAGASLVGSLTVGDPEYFNDGRVEVVKAVKIEQVIETIRRKTKEKLRADGSSETVAFDEKAELAKEGKILEVMGNAALHGSLGHQKVMAKRAAELDAYRRLAQRLMDIRIDSKTTVRDACLENDELVATLSQLVKGAEPIAIRYLDDGSCEVDLRITKRDIVRAVSNSQKGRTHTTRIEDSIDENSYVETGRGTMHPPEVTAEPDTASPPEPPVEATPSTPSAKTPADVFFETETIIRRLLEAKPVQR
jgi:hypothetical protein